MPLSRQVRLGRLYSTPVEHTVSIIIPTLGAECVLPGLLLRLRSQTLPPCEIIIVDSSSTDATVDIARREGCRTETIPRETFRHGRARNTGARLASSDVLVFMTQDALPTDNGFLAELIAPVAEGKTCASYARQMAPPHASPMEVFNRQFNYPAESRVKTLADGSHLGVKTFFFSDVASAISREVFEELGGFAEDIIANEDMHFCARTLRAGHAVAYQADAVVLHSHDYSIARQFRRYFDIGVFFAQAASLLRDVHGPRGEGWRYLSGQFCWLRSQRAWRLLPKSVVEAAAKFTAFQLGRAHRALPRWLNRRLSAQPGYWM